MRYASAVITALAVAFPYMRGLAQQPSAPPPPPPPPPAPPAVSAAATPVLSSPLFQEHTTLTLRLSGDLHTLLRDKGEKRTSHPARMEYVTATDSGKFDVKLRTRGIFRLKECSFPPIRVDLPTHKVAHTLFADQDKLKLVTHCQSGRLYEHNLLREYAVYRALNALTDTSFRVHLVHVTYVDSARKDTTVRYGFLIESDRELARRIGAKVFENNSVHDLLTDPRYMTLVSMFQYFIGNSDWSVWSRHNIAILRKDQPQVLFAVPYDFDFSGAVNAPYASPPPQFPIRSVRERYYRGYCQPDSVLEYVLARFRAAKDSMYAAVRSIPELPENDMKGLLSYFDEFFEAIGNRGMVQREFVRGCRSIPQ